MRIINISNKEILNILTEKENIVKEGRKINSKVEKKADKILSKELTSKGLEKVGNKFAGTWSELVKVVRQGEEIHEIIKKELSEELIELEVLENKVSQINETVSRMIDGLNLELGEFETMTKVYVEKGKVLIEVIDQIEEYKNRLKESKK